MQKFHFIVQGPNDRDPLFIVPLRDVCGVLTAYHHPPLSILDLYHDAIDTPTLQAMLNWWALEHFLTDPFWTVTIVEHLTD